MTIRRRWRNNLRVRITLAILVVTSVGSSLFALGVFLSNEGLEDVVLQRQVREELDTMVRLSHDYPVATRIESALLHGYVGQDNPDLPEELSTLAPGDYHSVPLNDRRYQILVAEQAGQRYYVAYDISEWEDRERQMIMILILGVILVSAAAVWLGFWASRQILTPVTQLAERVTDLEPNERNVRIAGDFEGFEVHTIAEAFDRFMARLDGFVEREQSFTEAASHELRTPLAVMQGAADVLQEQTDLNDTANRAVQRVQRGSREMREFIEALLFLSRESSDFNAGKEHCELSQIADQLVEDYRTLYSGNSVDVTFTARNQLFLNVPPSLPTIVISNLLRNALEHTQEGSVAVLLDNRVLTITDTGRGICADDRANIFERDFSTKGNGGGMGLYIVQRICAQFHWEVGVDSVPSKGTTMTVQFGTGDISRGRDESNTF